MSELIEKATSTCSRVEGHFHYWLQW